MYIYIYIFMCADRNFPWSQRRPMEMNFGAFGALVKQPTCTVEHLMLGVERRIEKGGGI